MQNNLVDIVRQFSHRVQNNRTLSSTSSHMRGEIDELDEEILKLNSGTEPGPDGIVGESIDVIACALDIIFRHAPEITDSELADLMLLKCQKWEDNYK